MGKMGTLISAMRNLFRKKKDGISDKKSGSTKIVGDEKEIFIESFLQLLPNLEKELVKFQSYKVKANEFDELEDKFKDIELNNQKLSVEKEKLEKEKAEFQQKIKEKDKEVGEKLKEIEQQNKLSKEFLAKIKKVDILKEFTEKVVGYINFLEGILKSYNEEIIKNDLKAPIIMSVLLLQALKKTTEMLKWKYICSDINENGIAILNKELKNCFQYPKEELQINAFKALSISKLKPATNAFLILCSANSKLSKFIENTSVSAIEKEFQNKMIEIKNKAKEIGIIEIDDVSLFEPIGNKQAISGLLSFPYSAVKNLNRDDISEIVEFGMKTEFEEMTKTKVLIF